MVRGQRTSSSTHDQLLDRPRTHSILIVVITSYSCIFAEIFCIPKSIIDVLRCSVVQLARSILLLYTSCRLQGNKVFIKRDIHPARYKEFYETQAILLLGASIQRSFHQTRQDVPPELGTWNIDSSTIETTFIMLNPLLSSFVPTHIAEPDFPTALNDRYIRRGFSNICEAYFFE
jgi:hypothetical protein